MILLPEFIINLRVLVLSWITSAALGLTCQMLDEITVMKKWKVSSRYRSWHYRVLFYSAFEVLSELTLESINIISRQWCSVVISFPSKLVKALINQANSPHVFAYQLVLS